MFLIASNLHLWHHGDMSKSHDCAEELRTVGSKVTPARLEVLAVLERATEPLTVHDFMRKLPQYNQVTLYRILHALVEAGVARKGESNRVTHFIYARNPHHHHMVCVDCGFANQCRTC